MEAIKQMKDLEKLIQDKMDDLTALEDREMELEPKHIKMMSAIYDSDLVSNLPNQTLRDSAVESLVLNDQRYVPIHTEYLMNKLLIKRTYRVMRYLEEAMKNRRTEINYLTFGGDKSE